MEWEGGVRLGKCNNCIIKDVGHGKKMLLLSWDIGAGSWVEEEAIEQSVFSLRSFQLMLLVIFFHFPYHLHILRGLKTAT